MLYRLRFCGLLSEGTAKLRSLRNIIIFHNMTIPFVVCLGYALD